MKKVISGGQTGVDRAGLDAALSVGIAIGGWCPKGRKAEDGVIPDRYPLTETATANYPERTRRNIAESDATLIFSCGLTLSGGTALTYRLCQEIGKPHRVIDLDDFPRIEQRAVILLDALDWLVENKVQTLNVAGPRESGNPGIGEEVRNFLEELFSDWIW